MEMESSGGTVETGFTERQGVRAVTSAYSNFMGSIAFAFIAAGVVSTFGNMLLIYTYCRGRHLRKKPSNIYTVHLATNNMILGAMALRIGYKIFKNSGAVDIVGCQVEGIIISFVHMNIMLTIAALFADRYVVICLSSSRSSWLSRCHYAPLTVIGIIWGNSMFWSLWPVAPSIPDYGEDKLIPCCIFNRTTGNIPNVFYVTLMSVSAFIAPLTFICFCMTRIFKAVRESSERITLAQGRRFLGHSSTMKSDEEHHEQNTSVVLDTMQNKTEQSHSISRTKHGQPGVYKPEDAIMKSAVVLVTTFSISWTPFLLLCIFNLAGVHVNDYIVVLSYLLSKASCIHSSYAYASHHHYKAAMGKLGLCSCLENIS